MSTSPAVPDVMWACVFHYFTAKEREAVLTRVCKYWNDRLLQASMVWNNGGPLELDNVETAKPLLRRYGARLVSLTVSFPRLYLSLNHRFLSHLPTLAHLHTLTCTSLYTISQHLSYVACCPHLRHLSLYGTSDFFEDNDGHSNNALVPLELQTLHLHVAQTLSNGRSGCDTWLLQLLHSRTRTALIDLALTNLCLTPHAYWFLVRQMPRLQRLLLHNVLVRTDPPLPAYPSEEAFRPDQPPDAAAAVVQRTLDLRGVLTAWLSTCPSDYTFQRIELEGTNDGGGCGYTTIVPSSLQELNSLSMHAHHIGVHSPLGKWPAAFFGQLRLASLTSLSLRVPVHEHYNSSHLRLLWNTLWPRLLALQLSIQPPCTAPVSDSNRYSPTLHQVHLFDCILECGNLRELELTELPYALELSNVERLMHLRHLKFVTFRHCPGIDAGPALAWGMYLWRTR